jgi:hypothetical protein
MPFSLCLETDSTSSRWTCSIDNSDPHPITVSRFPQQTCLLANHQCGHDHATIKSGRVTSSCEISEAFTPPQQFPSDESALHRSSTPLHRDCQLTKGPARWCSQQIYLFPLSDSSQGGLGGFSKNLLLPGSRRIWARFLHCWTSREKDHPTELHTARSSSMVETSSIRLSNPSSTFRVLLLRDVINEESDQRWLGLTLYPAAAELVTPPYGASCAEHLSIIGTRLGGGRALLLFCSSALLLFQL